MIKRLQWIGYVSDVCIIAGPLPVLAPFLRSHILMWNCSPVLRYNRLDFGSSGYQLSLDSMVIGWYIPYAERLLPGWQGWPSYLWLNRNSCCAYPISWSIRMDNRLLRVRISLVGGGFWLRIEYSNFQWSDAWICPSSNEDQVVATLRWPCWLIEVHNDDEGCWAAARHLSPCHSRSKFPKFPTTCHNYPIYKL